MHIPIPYEEDKGKRTDYGDLEGILHAVRNCQRSNEDESHESIWRSNGTDEQKPTVGHVQFPVPCEDGEVKWVDNRRMDVTNCRFASNINCRGQKQSESQRS